MLNTFISYQMQRVFDATNATPTMEKFSEYMTSEFYPKTKIEFELIVLNFVEYVRIYFEHVVREAIKNKLGLPSPPNIACDGGGFFIPNGYVQPEGVSERMDEIHAILRS